MRDRSGVVSFLYFFLPLVIFLGLSEPDGFASSENSVVVGPDAAASIQLPDRSEIRLPREVRLLVAHPSGNANGKVALLEGEAVASTLRSAARAQSSGGGIALSHWPEASFSTGPPSHRA